MRNVHSPAFSIHTIDESAPLASIAVVIVNYNTCGDLWACLETVFAEAPDEVIVVDNGSTDGSVEMVRVHFPQVTLLINALNPGYGAAANQAIARCRTKYVLLLNSDTRLQGGVLRALSAYLDQYPTVAVAGPRLINSDQTLQPSCFQFPAPLHILIEETSLKQRIAQTPLLRDRYLPTWSHAYARAVPWVLGAALAIRRTAFAAISGFDEAFHMYFEEVDLCYRLAAAGWQVHYAPVASIIHVGQASTSQSRVKMRVQLFASLRQFYQRHYARWKLVELNFILGCVALVKLIRDTLHLYLSQDERQRARIAEEVAIWQSVLIGRPVDTTNGLT